MVKIDLLEHELKGYWLANKPKRKIDREAIRAKHRGRYEQARRAKLGKPKKSK